ncbi:MAG TPA: DNA methyltransferase [Acidimicrobiales bacterium]|nr:DNA methyltransferase [Acidimicrobiales bacterium]
MNTMGPSDVAPFPEAIEVKRSDPVYMAHAYLTKVPVPGILPFIEAFTQPGDIVLDPFAGSGMTGVAALALGRRARLFDVSVLGRHIGRNYTNLVMPERLRKLGYEIVEQVRARLGDVYAVACETCGEGAQLAKTVWSMVMECGACGEEVNFYRALEAADWQKPKMTCPHCEAPFTSRSKRVAEEPVVDWISCSCSRTQREQDWTPALVPVDATGLVRPDVTIESTRQMYVASALGRHGLTSTGSFYSSRNLSVLAAMRSAIDGVEEPDLRAKLLFAFTAILTRASKRYQWSRQRPLNAANANYYVAPVFYEWNVFELFGRKVEAAIKSDDWIRVQRGAGTLFGAVDGIDISYDLASADALPLEDHSVDYVFTDPPFGSNIFYSDMNLFQEAWLGETTDMTVEAVVDRVNTGGELRTAARYEKLLTDALHECRRVVKSRGHITMVFGNSRGEMWQMVQRAIGAAGLEVVPEMIATLNKGQRSVKGLASGFENIATLDLMLTLRPASDAVAPSVCPTQSAVQSVAQDLLGGDADLTPSHLYLEILRHGFRHGWDLGQLDLSAVANLLRSVDLEIDPRSARVSTAAAAG